MNLIITYPHKELGGPNAQSHRIKAASMIIFSASNSTNPMNGDWGSLTCFKSIIKTYCCYCVGQQQHRKCFDEFSLE